METYLIAGLKVNMQPKGRTKEQAQKYLTEFTDNADIVINLTDEMIDKYHKTYPKLSLDDCFYVASGFAFYRGLLKHGGFMLHSSALCYNGEAYLFSGPSGIGKSTHTALWLELLKDKCSILNDDKPAIVLKNGKIYAYGTPWSGKHDLSQNIGLPVKALCFIARKETNEIQRLSNKDALVNIISQCTRNFKKDEWDLILGYMGEFVNKIPVYRLFCNKELDAAKLSFKTLTEAAL